MDVKMHMESILKNKHDILREMDSFISLMKIRKHKSLIPFQKRIH